MTYLLIDNSNTRTKFVLSAPDALLPERYMIPTREVSEERLDEVLAGVHYDAAVVCSVVPRVGEVLKNWIGKPCHFLSCDSRLGVGIDYPHPRQIGADRLANAVGAAAYYGCPCVVVDFGTAVTFDVIGPNAPIWAASLLQGLPAWGITWSAIPPFFPPSTRRSPPMPSEPVRWRPCSPAPCTATGGW